MLDDSCWQAEIERGFLIHPDPLQHLSTVSLPIDADLIEAVEQLAEQMPHLTANGDFRSAANNLPCIDFSLIDHPLALERISMLYGFFANAYLHNPLDPPSKQLPANLARPLHEVSKRLGRPPVLAYAGMVLSNWRRIDPAQGWHLANLDTLVRFTMLPDERWFFLIHVAIEAQAGKVLDGIRGGIQGAIAGDDQQVMVGLRAIRAGLSEMIRTFHKMVEGCDPDVYYQQIRPFLFGFDQVIFEDNSLPPQTLRGGSGAQSSVVPALLAALGIDHEQSDLTRHLDSMRIYMPLQHQQQIDSWHGSPLRAYVASKLLLKDAYNHCLRQLMTFRRAHLYFARTYIFEKSTTPVGTGGTPFMMFLAKLIEETQQALL